MFSAFSKLAILTVAAAFIGGTAFAAPLATCAVCSPSIVFEGVTRTLTLAREEESNTLQCNYDTPAIPGFSPGCLYANVDGELLFTNAGSACPSFAALVTQTSGACTASL